MTFNIKFGFIVLILCVTQQLITSLTIHFTAGSPLQTIYILYLDNLTIHWQSWECLYGVV